MVDGSQQVLVPAWPLPPENGLKEDHFRRSVRRWYMPFLVRFRGGILLVWLALITTSAIVGPRFLNLTHSDYDVPKGSDSALAIEAYKRNFPGAIASPPAFVVYYTSTLDSVLTPVARAASASMLQCASQYPDTVKALIGYYELSGHPDLQAMAMQSLSPDKRTMIQEVLWVPGASKEQVSKVTDALSERAQSLSTTDVSVSLTGMIPLLHEMGEATRSSFALMDAVVLPIATVILGIRLWSWRHMGMALLNLTAALLLGWTILVPIVANAVNMDPVAPSIMMSLGVGVSFDYTLFMLARMKEESSARRHSHEDAIFEMVCSAGRVILLSGSTLTATFVLLFFFPQNFLQSVAWSCTTITLTCMLANMTITPSMMLFFRCFAFSEDIGADDANAPRSKRRRSALFRISWWLTRPTTRTVALLGCLVVAVPCLVEVLHMIPTADGNLVFLQGSRSLRTLNLMRESFPVGVLDDYHILVETGRKGSVLTQTYFATENAVIHHLLDTQSEYMDTRSVTALSFFHGKDISWDACTRYLDNTSHDYNSSEARAYRILAASQANPDESAALITIQTLNLPMSQEMSTFIKQVRSYLNSYQPSPGGQAVVLHLFGAYTSTLDLQEAVYKLVPVEVALVLALVIIFIFCSFGSVLLSLRLLLTVAYSLCLTYGLLVCVYQPGAFHDVLAKLSLRIAASTGISWVVPIMSFSILVGLALDYDVLLICRFMEFRKLGWSDTASICLAIEKTGGIITTAGIIMMVSFAGLLVPKVLVLNQYAFSLVVGVFLDSFIVRPVLVPCVIAAFANSRWDNLTWWPRKMPVIKLSREAEERALAAGFWEPPDEEAEEAPSAARGDLPTEEVKEAVV